jgi:hypothetical protein
VKFLAKQEGITERFGLHSPVRTCEGVRELLAIALDCASPSRRAQENLVECKAILSREALRVSPEIGRKVLVGRFGNGCIFREKLHLLPHAAADDDVVAVEARRSALSVEYFVADIVVDEALQFLFVRRALPCAGETIRQVGNAGSRNNNPFGRFGFLPVDKVEEAKQSRAEHKKLEQRLSQQTEFQGVYQIGDV